MKKSRSIFLAMTALATVPATAFAWYGPVCYSDHIEQVTLTLQSLVGEAPGEIKVTFDNNGGIVELEAVKASKTVPGAHEIVLKRTSESENGIVGLIATSPRSSVGFKFELEFRKSPADCIGAILKVRTSSKASSKAVSKKENKPKVVLPVPVPVPVPEEEQAPVSAPEQVLPPPQEVPAAIPQAEPALEP